MCCSSVPRPATLERVKQLLAWGLVVACASCRPPSSTGDAGTPAVDPVMEQMAVLDGLNQAQDRVLRQLPAARDEAQALNAQLTDIKAKLGDAEVTRRMTPYQGRPLEQSALAAKADSTVVMFEEH